MSNDYYELKGVQAIQMETLKLESKLVSKINSGDKDISFDGEIQLYSSSIHTTETFEESVRVQVKGTGVEEFSESRTTHSLELKHYKNYLNCGGVLFFVVQVRKRDEKTKIFYKQLLPLELYKITNQYENQKYRVMELKALDGTSLENVCRSYLSEQKIQPIMYIGKEYKPDEFSYYKLRSLTYDSSSKLLDEEFYFYGVNKYEKMFPIDMITLKGFTVAKKRNFKIGKKNYNLFSEFHYEDSQQNLIVEQVLEMKFSQNRLTYEIKKFGTLETQLKIIPFLIDIFECTELECEEFKFKLNNNSKVSRAKEVLVETYSKLNKLQHIFEYLNIPINANVGEFGKNFNNQLMFLIKIFYDRDLEHIEVPEAVTFMDMYFGDLKIAVLNDPGKEIKMKNAFSKEVAEMKVVACTENIEVHTPVSIYILMSSKLMHNVINFNEVIVKQSFDKVAPFKDNMVFGKTNEFCLECIKAFDISGRFEFLSVAEYVYQKYDYISDEDYNSIVIFINKCQIEYRINGKLSEESIERLMNIKCIHNNNYGVLFSVNTLLGSKVEARYMLNKMPQEERNYFITLPIYEIYKK
ncbi:hypothetical protein KFF76_15000 [Bacillus subtilis]|uniref:hypothetical protein n=1 Tax=Bacillus subtilis TaxID=1423 RepID=UPI001BAC858B|nr:hypothetical protein [Bacillus subtilis]QWF73544.1 hypothetical protein KFF76_15000 [Bacillus subtilis]